MEDYEIIWSLRAVGELDAIGDYIARDRPLTAQKEIAAIQARVGQLARFPCSGQSSAGGGKGGIARSATRSIASSTVSTVAPSESMSRPFGTGQGEIQSRSTDGFG
jgi:plasmid stabilization system protein ParE